MRPSEDAWKPWSSRLALRISGALCEISLLALRRRELNTLVQ